MDAEIWDEKTAKKDQTGPHYFVHYKGWNKKQVGFVTIIVPYLSCSLGSSYRWDEWVPASRVLKDNAEGRGKQKTVKEVQNRAKEEKMGKDKQEKEKVSERAGTSGSNSRRDKDSAAGPSKDVNKANKKRTRDAAFDTVSVVPLAQEIYQGSLQALLGHRRMHT